MSDKSGALPEGWEECFTVIRQEDEHRIVECVVAFERVEQKRDVVVGEANFTIVERDQVL